MALKAVLTTLDGVPETLRGEYKEQDGKFYLDIEGIDDHHGVGALKRAKDYEKENARKHKEELTRATSELETAQRELEELRKNGVPKNDVERLEQSYKDKYSKAEKALQDRIAALTGSLERHMLEGEAMKMATNLAAKPDYVEAILPHIRSRLKLEEGENGEHVLRVLDKDGKPSAFNLDDLKKEVLGMKALAPLLAGSKAAGGGANGGGGNGGGAPIKLSDMNDAQRVQFAKDDPEGFQRAVAEAQQAAASRY